MAARVMILRCALAGGLALWGSIAVPAPAVAQAETSVLAAPENAVLFGVYFGSDSARLGSRAEGTLALVLSMLQQDPALAARLEAHADASFEADHNEALAEARAAAVADWLVQRGIAPERLSVTAFGESRPSADNEVPQGRVLNRRVEISLSR